MNFFEAMENVAKGNAVRRKAWDHVETQQLIKVENTLSHIVKTTPKRTVNAVRLSVQIGNSKDRPTFPGWLFDGDYKGQIASFGTDDVAANDWELVEEPKRARRTKEEMKEEEKVDA